jgi:NRPS condensation-like uncharacterized protein
VHENRKVDFSHQMVGERAILMLPFNVVLVGKIEGSVDPLEVKRILGLLQKKHPLLSAHAEMDEEGRCFLLGGDIPYIPVRVVERKNDSSWHELVKNELKTSFPIKEGPLVRCTLNHSVNTCEIILCAHHAICDGMSLGYLLRDLLTLLNEPEESLSPIIPPSISKDTVAKPPKIRPLQRYVMNLINKKWKAKGIRFSETDMFQMHERFWKVNDDLEFLTWAIDPQDTADLIERSKAEGVTVNSALWAMLLAAQKDTQPDEQDYRIRNALAVNTRDKLRVSVGEAFGFYASSLTVKLKYLPKKTLWENARSIHSKIRKEISKTNLFRMLVSELIHPTLLDSLYFSKYGLINDSLSGRFLKKMKWHEMSYGYAMTNVGRFDIPSDYGSLNLKEIYGPVFYSDIEEKIVGVITTGGKMSFCLVCRKSIVSDPDRLQESFVTHLKQAIQRD